MIDIYADIIKDLRMTTVAVGPTYAIKELIFLLKWL